MEVILATTAIGTLIILAVWCGIKIWPQVQSDSCNGESVYMVQRMSQAYREYAIKTDDPKAAAEAARTIHLSFLNQYPNNPFVRNFSFSKFIDKRQEHYFGV
ncbi:hypothetical protein CZP2022_221 [Vibrio phage C-ZP2022]|nr:hypothetical protein CZP2022_221 [Vibrio phage C-ZP2022]